MPSMSNKTKESAGAVQVDVRKIVTSVEEIWHEGGPRAKKPYRRGAIAAVVANPYAGRYVEDLTPMMDALKPLGFRLAAALIKALGGPKKVDAYGKSVIVGVAGGVCGGCHMKLPTQSVVSAKAQNELVACPSCSRILYFTADMG